MIACIRATSCRRSKGLVRKSSTPNLRPLTMRARVAATAPLNSKLAL